MSRCLLIVIVTSGWSYNYKQYSSFLLVILKIELEVPNIKFMLRRSSPAQSQIKIGILIRINS